jgi:hypothetical protein
MPRPRKYTEKEKLEYQIRVGNLKQILPRGYAAIFCHKNPSFEKLDIYRCLHNNNMNLTLLRLLEKEFVYK